VSSIYPLTKKLFSLQKDQKSRKESHKKELITVEVDADRISLHYPTTEVDADRISVRQHMDKEGDKNSKSMVNLKVQDPDIKEYE